MKRDEDVVAVPAAEGGSPARSQATESALPSPIRAMMKDMEDVLGDDEQQFAFIRRVQKALRRSPERTASGSTTTEHGASTRSSQFGVRGGKDVQFSVEQLYLLSETSVTARRLLAGKLAARRGADALDKGYVPAAAKAFAFAYRIGSHLVQLDGGSSGGSTVLPLFDCLGNDETASLEVRADALLVKANILLSRGLVAEGLHEISRAQALNPEDGALFAQEGLVLSKQQKKSAALLAFRRAAELEYDNIDHTMFHQALMIEDDEDHSLFLLEQFVGQAERDDQFFPEACYRLALTYGVYKDKRVLGKARRFYDLGMEGDRVRLPMFPDDASGLRDQARALLSDYHACGRERCSIAATKMCPCKLVWYCSQECQAMEWKEHKIPCLQARDKVKDLSDEWSSISSSRSDHILLND